MHDGHAETGRRGDVDRVETDAVPPDHAEFRARLHQPLCAARPDAEEDALRVRRDLGEARFRLLLADENARLRVSLLRSKTSRL